MSGLARLLAGRIPPGVYHWTSAASIDDVRHAVEHAHWQFILLETWTVEDKDGFLTACQQAFGLPESFARNFDALGDALSEPRRGSADGDPADRQGVVVVWDGWGPVARAVRRVFDVGLDVLSARVDDDRTEPFAVLLRGPGPDTDLAELDPHGPLTA